ncbi:MAG: response regulator, partial [Anaerolineae bacterium]|nr:response regulator [Anaerolineae bacterium]
KALQARTDELQASEIQLRHAKDAAEAASHAKSAFLANISHELRSPLNAIIGFAQIVKRDRALTRDVQENIGVILGSGEHLLALINQVLDMSKIEAGKMTLDETTVDLYRMLTGLQEMFTLAAQEKHLRLDCWRSDDLPQYIKTDATKLRQSLINLIGNALKFTDSGEVSVRAKRAEAVNTLDSAQVKLTFEISDTGPGIPADEIPQLFEAFTRSASVEKAASGTGLGLPITRQIVRLMGGDITISSEVGHGTTISFTIACAVASGAEIPPERFVRTVVGVAPDQPRYRILIVDDRWTNRQLLLKVLQPAGFDVREADNGRDAISIAQTFKPHLVWMDLHLPIISGLEAARRLKAMPEFASMIIIALTASAYDDERTQALASGCDDLMHKPFRTAHIFEMMGKHLGIKYVYEDEPRSDVTSPSAQLTVAEIRDKLPDLPSHLIEALVDGV